MTNILKKARNLFVHQHWNIGISRAPIQTFLTEPEKPPVNWLTDEKPTGFISDPFGIEKDGKLFLFFEFLDYATWKGEIRCRVMDIENFGLLEERTVFKFDCHLSYPFLLQWQGETFCVPEMAGSGRVELFRSTHFPFEWKKEATLLPSFAGIDNTIINHEGKWWMFNSDLNDMPKQKAFLWFADQLTGPWHPHPQNPVKNNITSARPGGSMFRHNGELYRPTQDCTIRYGEAMTFNRIISMNPQEFEEEEARVIHPYQNTSYNQALHTLAEVSPNITLVDGRAEKFLWPAFKGKIKKYISS